MSTEEEIQQRNAQENRDRLEYFRHEVFKSVAGMVYTPETQPLEVRLFNFTETLACELKDFREQVEQRNSALVAALKRYGCHRYDCNHNFIKSAKIDHTCTCGLEQALASAEGK